MRASLLLCLSLVAAAAAVENKLCSSTAAPGGYTAVDPTTVPSSVTAAVAAAFEANTSLVYNGQPYGACPNIVVVPDQACSQVVAGTNYWLTATLYCRNANNLDQGWSNGAEAVTVEAKVFVPLPSANQAPSVTSLQVQLVLPKPAVVPTGPPVNNNSLCSTPPSGMTGAYQPRNVSDVPAELPAAVAEAFLDSDLAYNNETFFGCYNYTVTVTAACSQVVAGTNWLTSQFIICKDADLEWANGAESVVVVATTFQPLPYTKQPLNVTAIKLEGVVPRPPVPLKP